MIRLFCFALVALSLLSLSARANERYRAWQQQHPFTQSAWETHRSEGGEDVDMPYFLGSGLNTFWDGVRSGSEASTHPNSRGLPTLLMADLGGLEQFQMDFRKAQHVHSNLIGVVLGDEIEPKRAKDLRGTRDWIINNSDPQIASLITISSVPSNVSPDHLRELKEALEPDVFLFQHYPDLRKHEWQPDYFSVLERLSTWTRKNDVAFWVYPRVYSTTYEGIASESELRLQRFTTLAYGASGLVDFMWPCYSPPSVRGAGYWDGSGEPTPMYKFLAPINREIANLAKSLVCLTPLGVYHLNKTGNAEHFARHWMDSDADMPNRLRRTWKLVNVSGTLNRNNLMVGFFRDDAGQEYFMVVNKECAADKTGAELVTEVNLTFHPSVNALQRLRRSDGAVESIAVSRNYTFMLPGGTSDLFKFDTGAPFAGIDPIRLPSLTSTVPANNSTLPRVQGNRLVLNFDRDAVGVSAEIREIADDGKVVGNDLSEFFTRSMTEDNRSVIYQELGQILQNNRTYQIALHGVTRREPLLIRTCRGDVDGDGSVSQKDVSTVQQTRKNSPGPDHRADLNADGVIDDVDVQIVSRLLQTTKKFQWVEDFEHYPLGPLTGHGPWLAIESLPAHVITKAVVQGPAQITTEHRALHGAKKLQGGAYPDYRGNEAVFCKERGFGDTGILRVRFMARLGTSNAERMLLTIANSHDAQGTTGVLNCEVLESDVSRLYTTRGVELVGASDGAFDVYQEIGARQGPQGRGVQVEAMLDFDANTITWSCENLEANKRYGPRTVRYQGRFDGLDSVSFWVCGQETQVDRIVVQNY